MFYAFTSDFQLQKAFSPYLSVQTMVEMVIFCLFQDILAAILKNSLCWESPKFCKYVR